MILKFKKDFALSAERDSIEVYDSDADYLREQLGVKKERTLIESTDEPKEQEDIYIEPLPDLKFKDVDMTILSIKLNEVIEVLNHVNNHK